MATTTNPISNVSPTNPTTTASNNVPKISALVIGIDKYLSTDNDNLTAAVRDADSFERYLLTRLHVPKENIISLRDEAATRDAIMDAFQALQRDVPWHKDEGAVIIYYAGHGGRVEKPSEWTDWDTNGEMIEMLCPHDIGTTRPGTDDVVQGIPDRTIAVLLNHLSAVRGDNITLILDCCNSAGISRAVVLDDDEECEPVPRRLANPPPLTGDCDRSVLSDKSQTRGAGVASGFVGKFHQSHVLLAACGRAQLAYENPKTGRGFFTSGLLKVLESTSVDDLTYTSLMHRLLMPRWQTPHCEGQNVNRRLFNNRAQGADGTFIVSKVEKVVTDSGDEEKQIIMQAGAAQGVTANSIVSVHATNLIQDAGHPNPALGSLIVTQVHAFSSILTRVPDAPEFRIPRLFYSKITTHADTTKTRVCCSDKAWLERLVHSDDSISGSISIVDTPGEADLCLTITGSEVVFTRTTDPLITPHIGTRIGEPVDIADTALVQAVIRGFLDFHYHLTRAGKTFAKTWADLRELRPEFTKNYDTVMLPFGPDLLAEEPAELKVKEGVQLGMTIHNQSDVNLYPWVFYFDPTDLSIYGWYIPPFGAGAGTIPTSVDFPLPARSKLTVGFGEGGAPPWQFGLRPGETKDLGFFKIFLTTKPANFSSIAQNSPFEGQEYKPRRGDDDAEWGVLTKTVIQHA